MDLSECTEGLFEKNVFISCNRCSNLGMSAETNRISDPVYREEEKQENENIISTTDRRAGNYESKDLL